MATRTEELLAQVIEELKSGRHYRDVMEGRVFSQTTTPLGLAFPIYTATALGGGGLPLWNPPNSGVNVELLKVNTGRASGTSDFGAIGIMARKLDAIATGAIMTALAEVAPVNALVFGGKASRTRSSNAGTNTVTAGAAGDFVRQLFATSAEADATTAGLTRTEEDLDGTLVVPPGVLIYLAMTKASVALFSTTVIWKERPL